MSHRLYVHHRRQSAGKSFSRQGMEYKENDANHWDNYGILYAFRAVRNNAAHQVALRSSYNLGQICVAKINLSKSDQMLQCCPRRSYEKRYNF